MVVIHRELIKDAHLRRIASLAMWHGIIKHMVIAFVVWWYGAGWRRRALFVRDRLARVMDAFSIDLLLKTLFAPFRQISADGVDGPLNMKIRAWFDKLISRMVGAVVRLLTIMVGVIVLFGTLFWGLAILTIWPLIPLLPVVGVILTGMGWMPWR